MELSIKRTKLSRKLLLLYILNVADWICTVVLVHSDRFYEANPLMRTVIPNLPVGFLCKCILPAVGIAAVIFVLRFLGGDELRLSDRFISFALVFYAALNLDHTMNFLLLIFQISP